MQVLPLHCDIKSHDESHENCNFFINTYPKNFKIAIASVFHNQQSILIF